MALGYTGAYGAAGGAAGLETLLARRLAQAKFEEEQRQARATEAHNQRQLQEQSRLREAQLAQTKADREATQAYRESNLNLSKLREADLEGYRTNLLGLRGEAETRQQQSAKDIADYREKALDLRDRNMQLSNAVALGQLDARRAQLEIAKNNAELAQARLELDKLRATPAHAGEVAGAETAAREAAKSRGLTLPGLLQGIGQWWKGSSSTDAPTPGTRRIINGKQAMWDGKGWVAQ